VHFGDPTKPKWETLGCWRECKHDVITSSSRLSPPWFSLQTLSSLDPVGTETSGLPWWQGELQAVEWAMTTGLLLDELQHTIVCELKV
jgi:hypothetical protein